MKKEKFVEKQDNMSVWNLIKKYKWKVDIYDIDHQKILMTMRKLDANMYNDDNKQILSWNNSIVIPAEHMPIFNKDPEDRSDGWMGLRYTKSGESPKGYVINLDDYTENDFKNLLTELSKIYDKEFYDKKKPLDDEITKWLEIKRKKEFELKSLMDEIVLEQNKLDALLNANSNCQKDRINSEDLIQEYNNLLVEKKKF